MQSLPHKRQFGGFKQPSEIDRQRGCIGEGYAHQDVAGFLSCAGQRWCRCVLVRAVACQKLSLRQCNFSEEEGLLDAAAVSH
jgi:hypothetical protein